MQAAAGYFQWRKSHVNAPEQSLHPLGWPQKLSNWAHHHARLTLDEPCELSPGYAAFRRADTPIAPSKGARLPDARGLRSLRASGSSQFSLHGLHHISHMLPKHHPIYVVDLRQERHGFDGEIALGYWRAHNSDNAHCSRHAVLHREAKSLAKLSHLPPGSHFTAYAFDEGRKAGPKAISLVARKVSDEHHAVKAYDMHYARIPMTDRSPEPPAQSVETFVDFVQTLPKNAWLHFHCLHGHGRTTLFMTMYDALRNADRVNLDDLVCRQYRLGGIDLHAKPLRTRLFLRIFYRYAQVFIDSERHGRVPPMWTRWREQDINPKILESFMSQGLAYTDGELERRHLLPGNRAQGDMSAPSGKR